MTTPPADPVRAARVLGRFVRALHRPAPADAPPNPYRGVPLADRDEATRARIDELADRMPSAVDPGRLRAAWDAHVALPPWDGPPLWLHGDLHAHNVVVRDGETTAVIDFGDITAGDPATDLFVAWMLLPPDARPVFQAAAAADDLTWARARGWALTLALAYVGGSQSTPDFVALGHRTLEAVLADDWAI
jgi:aminoglycoside phosphotransferase (APT) family kinase protein